MESEVTHSLNLMTLMFQKKSEVIQIAKPLDLNLASFYLNSKNFIIHHIKMFLEEL